MPLNRRGFFAGLNGLALAVVGKAATIKESEPEPERYVIVESGNELCEPGTVVQLRELRIGDRFRVEKSPLVSAETVLQVETWPQRSDTVKTGKSGVFLVTLEPDEAGTYIARVFYDGNDDEEFVELAAAWYRKHRDAAA